MDAPNSSSIEITKTRDPLVVALANAIRALDRSQAPVRDEVVNTAALEKAA